MIIIYLEPDLTVSLTLICRDLYFKNFDPSVLQSSPASKGTLLHWLEQDILSLYYCHGCIYLGDNGLWMNQDIIHQLDNFLICRHLPAPLYQSGDDLFYDGSIFGYQPSHRLFQGGQNPIEGRVLSCPVCFTDYKMEIALLDSSQRRATSGSAARAKVWTIRIHRWHKLGECRSPDDPLWHSLVTSNPRDE
ncbi:hypothetical protein B0T24DRAFT_714766 [Lasiosphaeria ovina]|uniref:Uncharacterized protein n=1 Tax=Lasiosphaeria ovina TaxID=92902 RepID=A0AAE0TX22_9PEZI|nr:hypothetical protein B0T24DRAFT_714766 [Lasiosphaeria ovina]